MTLPNFLIIGAAKCGTTSLYNYLDQHPGIYMSPVKEPRFFALEGEKPDFRGPADRWGINRCRFTDLESYRDLFRGVSDEQAVGEASTLYLYSRRAPDRIRDHVPDAKLLAVLRDPVERAYSAFLWMARDGREPLSDFGQALREEEARIAGNWGPEYHYRQRGFYHSQLKRYFDRFDRDRIQVHLYEDLAANPSVVVKSILRFLEVDDTFTPDISARHNISGVPKSKVLQPLYLALRRPNPIKAALRPLLPPSLRRRARSRVLGGIQRRNLAKAPPMPQQIRAELSEAYQEDILKLQELIHRDLSGWLA